MDEFQLTLLCSNCGAPMLFDTTTERPAVQSPYKAALPLRCIGCSNAGEIELTACKAERLQ
jgi:hypothetical protein